MINLILYCALGIALAASGVSIMEKPWQFIVIMLIVVAINYNERLG
jgi:hypothetical protein